MSYPAFKDLSDVAKARDWKAGITPAEYAQAKSARTEMLKQLASRSVPHTPKRKSWADRMSQRAKKFVQR